MNLGNILADQGKLHEAQGMLDGVIQGYSGLFGPRHYRTLIARANLAYILFRLGELAEARDIYEQVIAGFTEQVGPRHYHTLQAKERLAAVSWVQDAERKPQELQPDRDQRFSFAHRWGKES